MVMIAVTLVVAGSVLAALGMILRGSEPGERRALLDGVAEIIRAWRSST